jgi:uncharacterized protein (DUF1330 family)
VTVLAADGDAKRGVTMAAYVIAHIDVQDPVRYEDYKSMSPVSIEQYGGRFIARGGAVEVLEGNWQPKRLVLLEFPTADAARQWYASEEYAPARALRQATSTGDLVMLEGV